MLDQRSPIITAESEVAPQKVKSPARTIERGRLCFFVNETLLARIAGIVRDDASARRIAVADMFEPLGHEPHLIMQAENARRGGDAPAGVDEHDIAIHHGAKASWRRLRHA